MSPEEFIGNITDETIQTLAHNLQLSRVTEIGESVLQHEEQAWPEYEAMHVEEEERKEEPVDMSFHPIEEPEIQEIQTEKKEADRTSYFDVMGKLNEFCLNQVLY